MLLCVKALVAFQHIKLPDSCSFLFYFFPQQHLILYSHFFDYTSTKILIHNNTDHAIKIPLYYQLSCVIKLPYKNCFVTSTDLNVASTPPTLPTIFYDYNGIPISPTGDLETDLPNGIKIYNNKEAINVITCLVNKYSSI